MTQDRGRSERLLHEIAPKMTDEEYLNLKDLLTEYCKIPLLAEFRAPVAVLYPALAENYGKIVQRPIDLGKICRRIERKKYECTRDIRLDIWLMFANCENYHLHQDNPNKLPVYAAIGTHLREHFNVFWQEFMLPSDLPAGSDQFTVNAFNERRLAREERLRLSGSMELNQKHLAETFMTIRSFVHAGGCVDRLDKEPLWNHHALESDCPLKFAIDALLALINRPVNKIAPYRISDLYVDMVACGASLDGRVLASFTNRLTRLFWKRCALLHEAKWRGSNLSAVFGVVMDVVWCREKRNKPYWPCLKLGLRNLHATNEQIAITNFNLGRLPPHFIPQLDAQCRRLVKSNPGNDQSTLYFVEYLGLHVYDWVAPSNVVAFDGTSPDPNIAAGSPNNAQAFQDSFEKGLDALHEIAFNVTEALNGYDESVDAVKEYRTMHAYDTLVKGDDNDVNDHVMSETDVKLANLLLSNSGAFDSHWVQAKRPAKRHAPEGPVTTRSNVATKRRFSEVDDARTVSHDDDIVRVLAATVEQLSSDQGLLKKENEQLAGRYDVLEGNYGNLLNEKNRLAGRLTTVERSRTEDHDMIKRLEDDNRRLAERLTATQSQGKIDAVDLVTSKGANEKLIGRVAALETDCKRLSDELDEVRKDGELRTSQAAEEATRYQDEVRRQLSHNAQLTETKHNILQQLQNANQERDESLARVEQLSVENRGLQEKQSELQRAYNASAKSIEKRCQQLQLDKEQLRADFMQLNGRTATLESDMQDNVSVLLAELLEKVGLLLEGEHGSDDEPDHVEGLVGRLIEQVNRGAAVEGRLFGLYEGLARDVQQHYDHLIREVGRLDASHVDILGSIERIKAIILENFEAVWKVLPELDTLGRDT